MCCGGEGGGRQGGGGVSHIGAGIILSASCSLALFYFMFKVTGREWLIRTRLIRSST